MAVLAQYLFGTVNAGESGVGYSADTTASGLTNSVIGNGGANISVSLAMTGTYPTNPVCLALTAGVLSDTVAAAVANACYVDWTITPDSGKKFSLTNLTFDIARGGAAAPRGYAIRSSLDAYAANIATADVPTVRSTFTSVDIDLTGPSYQNLTSALTMRMYLYTPSLGQSIEFDSITVNGTVADINPAASPTINPGYGTIFIRLSGGADKKRVRWSGRR